MGTQTVKYFETLSAEGSSNVVTSGGAGSGFGGIGENSDMRGDTASTSTHSSSTTSTGELGGHPMVGGVEEGEGILEGVGRVHVRLIAAFKSRVHDAADGDHYVTVSIEGLGVGSTDAPPPPSFFRSQTVTSSATPVFNRQWTLPAPHYKVRMVQLLDVARLTDPSLLSLIALPILLFSH